MNENNNGLGLTVNKNYQCDEIVREKCSALPSKVFLTQTEEGAAAVSSDTLCITAVTDSQ